MRGLGERGHTLFEAALGRRPRMPATRRELARSRSPRRRVTTGTDSDAPSANSPIRRGPRRQGCDARRIARSREGCSSAAALAKEPASTTTADLRSSSSAMEKAPAASRVIYAIELLRELDQLPKVQGLDTATRAALSVEDRRSSRIAALPLYAKVDPTRAGGEVLAPHRSTTKAIDKPTKIAAALAWGEVARTGGKDNSGAAQNALDRMLKDEDRGCPRRRRSRPIGNIGVEGTWSSFARWRSSRTYVGARSVQRSGLANATLELNGSSGALRSTGSRQLWREKGRPRRDAARGLRRDGEEARGRSSSGTCTFAQRTPEDPALHPIGVEGLCNAALANNPEARRALAWSTDRSPPPTCVARPDQLCRRRPRARRRTGSAIALKLVRRIRDGEIRADVARILALAAAKGQSPTEVVGDALVALARRSRARRPHHRDPCRSVRLGADAPKAAAAADGEAVHLRRRGREAHAPPHGHA